MERVSALMLQGPIRETGNPLDLAIEGEGFFAVRSEDQIFYTRKGN
jgi:Flagellar basal body rod protein